MKKGFWVIVTIVFLATCSLAFMLFKGYLRFNYPSSEEYPIRGIDISHHQGSIQWEELIHEDVSFVFIKATEGGDYVDPRFAENWENSKKHEIPVGAYHFYRLCKGGLEQAKNFISTVPNIENNLPPVIDLEFGGNCETDKTSDQILSEVQDFIDNVGEHYGKKPIIYATQEFYDQYLVERFAENPIWIRDIFREPKLSDREWTFWQFTNRAHLSGIDMYVDINVFNGNKTEFKEFSDSN